MKPGTEIRISQVEFIDNSRNEEPINLETAVGRVIRSVSVSPGKAQRRGIAGLLRGVVTQPGGTRACDTPRSGLTQKVNLNSVQFPL